MCVAPTGFSSSVLLDTCRGTSSTCNKNLPSMLETKGQLVCSSWCTKQCIFASKVAEFFLHLFGVGLAWCTIHIYCSAISAFLEPLHHHKDVIHPNMCKVMCNFYLQHFLSHKWFDPWNVEQLLSMLVSWAPASYLTNFKFAWKIFAQSFIWRLTYTVLSLLGRSWMDLICLVYFGVTIHY